jgi:uncharacterized membrane protein
MTPFTWRRSLLRSTSSLTWIVSLTACAGSDPGAGKGGGDAATNVPQFNGDCSSVTVPTFSELSSGVFSHCVVCHASSLSGEKARNGSPDTVNFDTYDAAKAMASYADQAVRGHIMPYPNGVGITDADRNQLYEWAECGTPP